MKTIKLHLIRHGTTQGNLEGVYVGGSLDLPLCEEGAQTLRGMCRRYRYPTGGVLFTSPMLRAKQTAEILYPGFANVVELEALRENRFGEFEGKKAVDLLEEENFRQWLNPQSSYVPKGGESGAAFAKRVAGALHTMLMYQAQNGIFEAVCVTHGGVIMSMLGQKALPKRPMVDWAPENGCGYTVQTSAALLMRGGPVEVAGLLPYGWQPDDTV